MTKSLDDMEVKEERDAKRKLSTRVIEVLEKVAEKKANATCRGYMYEPKVPKKLQR